MIKTRKGNRLRTADIGSLITGISVEVKGQFVGRDFDGKKRIHVTNPDHYIKIYKEE